MTIVKLLVPGLWAAGILLGQAEGIAVSVSRVVDLDPEEAVVSVMVQAEPDATLTQVLEAIKDIGVTAKNLNGIGSYQTGPQPSQVRFVYNFAVTTQFARYKELLDKISSVRRTLIAAGSTLDLATTGIQISASEGARLLARQRLLPDLIAEARRRGTEIAEATNVSLGRILGLEFGPDLPLAGLPYYGPFGPVGPSTLRISATVNVRFAIQ